MPLAIVCLLATAASVLCAAQAQEPGQKVLPKPTQASATNLRVTAECSRSEPGTRVAHFTWTAGRAAGARHRVDVSMFRDGFQKEKYQTVAQPSGKETSAEWKAGDPGVKYYWRVLTLSQEGWAPSETARYEAPVCPVDLVPEPPK